MRGNRTAGAQLLTILPPILSGDAEWPLLLDDVKKLLPKFEGE